jgi:aryl carrier-like protein
MGISHQLIREAEATERLAQLVSYGPDKQRLLRMAEDLRRRAEAAGLREVRSWRPAGDR